MSIIPSHRPKIFDNSFWKVVRYFFGADGWKEFKVIEVAVRASKNRVNFYDDENHVWTKASNVIKSFNWNTDPSAYVLKGTPKAVLRTGVHKFKLSYHHLWENAKRYVALRPDTLNESVPVFRWDAANKKWRVSTGQAINQHYGGLSSTWSEGCQTAPKPQYPEFITHVANGLGYRLNGDPTRIVKIPDQALVKGIKGVVYILITQEQFEYIMRLEESQFDSAADLKYQQENFVNVPKVEIQRPDEEEEVPNGAEVLTAIEIEDQVDQLDSSGGDSVNSSVTPPSDSEGAIDNIPSESTSEPIDASTKQTADQITNIDQSQKTVPDNFTPQNITQEAPPPSGILSRAWKWLAGMGLIPTTGVGVFAAIQAAAGDGSVSFKDVLTIMREMVVFLLPYLFWVALVFLIIWGIKELLKQVSTIVNNYTLARGDMNNVKIVPFGTPPVVPKETTSVVPK